MNKLIFFALLSICCLSYAASPALDYCSTINSWPAQKTLSAVAQNHESLDLQHATSSLLTRTRLEEKDKPVTMGEWGELYTQTVKISIPFIKNQKPPLIIIASSIISAQECSLTDPAYIEISMFETSLQK